MDYRYVLRKVRTNDIVGELALHDVSYGYALNGYGSFSARVAMADPIGDPFASTVPQKFVVCVERDAQLVWSGVLWSRSLDFDRREITVQGNEWGSVFDKTVVAIDIPYAAQRTRDVIDMVTSGISTQFPLPAGWRTGTGGGLDNFITGVFPLSAHPSQLAAINQLAQDPINGFEYRWDSQYNASGALLRYMICGSPLGAALTNPVDHHAPGGQGIGDHVATTYSRDERDAPFASYGFSADGFQIHTAIQTFADAVADQPFYEAEAVSYNSITDQQISDLTDQRVINNFPDSTTFRPFAIHKLGIVNPLSPSAYGNVGDVFPFIHQERPQDTPFRRHLRILALDMHVDDVGQETLTLSAAATPAVI